LTPPKVCSVGRFANGFFIDIHVGTKIGVLADAIEQRVHNLAGLNRSNFQ
jgi:hypothetical protein